MHTTSFSAHAETSGRGFYNVNQVELFNRYLSKILPTWTPYDFKNKQLNQSNNMLYMLNRTQRIFNWEGLPDTIPPRMLETYLQINGNVCFYRYNGNLYVFTGGLGGEPDEYYRPTIYTIANPALNLNVNAKINTDCVVMPNDSYYVGLIPLISKYTSLMSENELSMILNIIQSRIVSLISADDDRTEKSARLYIEKIIKGEIDVISSSQFFEGLKTSPYSTNANHSLTDLIEMEQYIKASLYNELGINANYNMKRESLNTEESLLNQDALFPLIDDMLYNRKTYAEKVNDMFDTNISVSLDSAWKDNKEELEESQNNIDEGGTSENEEIDRSDNDPN